VPVEDEVRLKEKARGKDLLMMGPDCGTAIINGVALAFANVVKRGDIGIVGASGTGSQEVSVLIDKFGGGVSQLIGTGGRDLSEKVGGITMIQGLEALIEDEATKVIVLISKPPAESVAAKIYEIVKQSPKPVVVDFIGADPQPIRDAGGFACVNLEHAAAQAVALSRGQSPEDLAPLDEQWQKKAREVASELSEEQEYLLGLYTGGTLADEALKLLGNQLGGIYSNIAFDKEHQLDDLSDLNRHVVLDLGDDQFTQGRPHPMIDPFTRSEHLESDVSKQTAVLLFDCVLGYGSHPDPAAEVAKSINKLKENGITPVAVGSVCGTEGDPQDLQASQKVLEEAGAIIFPSNAKAVEFAGLVLGQGRA
jgi:succinyl-CoA synthetase alpha subunit